MMQRPQQQGMAIMMVLYIMVVVVFVTSGVYYTLRFTLDNTTQYVRAAQIYEYGLGVELLAKELLAEDEQVFDHLEEDWTQLQEIEIPNGVIRFQILDAQSKFNLNNLSDDSEVLSLYASYAAAAGIPESVFPVVQDWIDPDEEARSGGAESAIYLLNDPPYYAANKLMGDISEAALLNEVDGDLYALIAQYFTALPDVTQLNVNTAPEAIGQLLIEAAKEANPNSTVPIIGNFLNEQQGASLFGESPYIGVKSRYFVIDSNITLGSYVFSMNTMVYRPDEVSNVSDIETISRNLNMRAIRNLNEEER